MARVFLHGLGQGPDSWQSVCACLSPAPDDALPDLAALLRRGDGTYRALLASLASALEALPGPLDLCGLSLGAVLALDYAARRPERVRSLVLIAPQLRMPRRLLALQDLLFRLLPERLVTGGTDLKKAELLTLTRSMADLDLTAPLPGLACPALVVCGARDRANLPAARELAGLLPEAELRVFPGTGHALNRETPELLAQVLGAFWSNRP